MTRKPVVLSDDLAMPLDVMTRATGVFGQRGTGKSTTGAVTVEQVVNAGGRSVAMDPTGVWFGLTRAGTGPGLPGVVLGGEHADAPLEVNAGALVAEFVIASDYPLVILDMKLMRKYQRQHFAMEFLEALYHDNRDPLLVVMDEAAQFAPQMMRGTKGDASDSLRLLGAVEDMVKLGRSRGLGALLIEQRIATLNANVREQIETLIAHRLAGPLDRKALREWVNAQGEPEREAEALALIAKLDQGRALVWSPSFLHFFGVVAMHNSTTFDSRATPEVGKIRTPPGPRAPVDLDTLRDKMSAAIEEAKANDPKELRRELALTKKRLAECEEDARALVEFVDDVESATGGPHVIDELLAVYQAAKHRVGYSCDVVDEAVALRDAEPVAPLSDEDWQRVEALVGDLDGFAAKITAAQARRRLAHAGAVVGDRRVPDRPRTQPAARPIATEGLDLANADSKLNRKAERMVLSVLAQYPDGRTKKQTAILAGYALKGGGFNGALSKLRTLGYIEGSDHLTITSAGMSAIAGQYAPLPTGRALLDHWLSTLNRRAEREVLLAVYNAGGEPIAKDNVAAIAGYEVAGGGFNGALSKLRTLELIEGSRELRVSESLLS